MTDIPLISHRISHQTRSTDGNPKQTLQIYILRPNTTQSVIDFQFLSMIDFQGNFSETITEIMEDMLTYHDIHHPNLTYLIEETKQYVINEARANINTLANDLQVTLTIKDYNPNATSRLDVDLIITDLEGTNRPPTTEEENDMCIVCFGNYSQHNNLCTLTCGHSFHFACIDQWLRRNISCPICR
ncbi:hypothetical protein HID58_014001 [Brassica napus]|uniref:RING-type E3 ubiquitin transferase n=1 Tax=Brassica napus TaxID=3708 RepID=A0ABQ8DFV8_BRANA|nr:hypothetical protein HID58_014001 [Brassica napus]